MNEGWLPDSAMEDWSPESAIFAVGGNPTVLREMSGSLTAGGLRLLGISNALSDLQTADRWESPAGDKFAQAIAGVLPVLRALHRRFATAASVLETYAEEVAQMQRRAERAADERRRAQESIRQGQQIIWDARPQPDAAQIERIFTERELELRKYLNAVRLDYERACEQFRDVDRRCAATLKELLSDSIADSRTYRVLAEIDEFGDRVGTAVAVASLVPHPVAQVPAAAGDATFGAARVSLLVFYDEGSWKSIATSSAFSAAGRVAAGAKIAAVTKGRFTKSGDLINPPMTAKQRLAAGAKESLANSVYGFVGRKITPAVKDARPVTKPFGGKMPARERARLLAVQTARKKFLNDWQVATANGPQMQALYLTGTVGGFAVSGAKSATTKAGGATNRAAPLCADGPNRYPTKERAASAANLSLGVCNPQVSEVR